MQSLGLCGTAIGEMLQYLLDAVIDGQTANEREALLALAQEQCFSLRQLEVNGRDMQSLGLCGTAIGEMLQYLLNAVIDGQTANEREALLRLARTRKEEQHDQ